MNWAAKRRLQYLAGFFGVIFIILFIIFYPVIFKKPTCNDGKKNGNELGVDCGGSCSLICKDTASDPLILWSRAFNVVGNDYNLVAYVENQNRDAAIEKISYEFRIYDDKNLLIGRRQGTAYIPPNRQFAIFEPRFNSGQSVVKSVMFDFTEPFVWVKKEPTLNTLPIYVDNIAMGNDGSSPSLSARIKNDSVHDLPQFDVIAILYDKDGNAINASKTVKSGLLSGSSSDVTFTWPEALSDTPVKKDVIIMINPFSVSF